MCAVLIFFMIFSITFKHMVKLTTNRQVVSSILLTLAELYKVEISGSHCSLSTGIFNVIYVENCPLFRSSVNFTTIQLQPPSILLSQKHIF